MKKLLVACTMILCVSWANAAGNQQHKLCMAMTNMAGVIIEAKKSGLSDAAVKLAALDGIGYDGSEASMAALKFVDGTLDALKGIDARKLTTEQIDNLKLAAYRGCMTEGRVM